MTLNYCSKFIKTYNLRAFSSSVVTHLPSDIEVIAACDLFKYGGSCRDLYNFFLPFKSYTFEHTQRILVLDSDTDYFPGIDCVGNNLFNIVKIMSGLDISTNHVTIFSKNHGIVRDLKSLCNNYNLTPPKLLPFDQFYTFPESFEPYSLPQIKKSFLYTCLNSAPRTHRKILISMLHQKNLLDCGIVSWYGNNAGFDQYSRLKETVIEKDHTNYAEVPVGMHLQTTEPYTNINEELNLCPLSAALLKKHNSFLDQQIKHPLLTGIPNCADTRWQADFFNHAALYLITESVGQYRYSYFSEKTWKAMMSKTPFLLLGAKHSLQTLRDLGFKTFDAIWSEDYDSRDTLYDRVNMITDVLTSLRTKNWDQLSQQCLPIVEHNFNNMKQLQKKQLDQLKDI